MCDACAHKTFGTRGFRPAPPRPRGARGDTPGLTHTQDRAAAGHPFLGQAAPGVGSAAQASAEQRLGCSPRLGKAAAGAAASPAPAPPPLTQRSWTPTREAGSRLHARSRAQQGPATMNPAARRVTGIASSSPPNSPSQAPQRCFVIFQAARVVILTMGTGLWCPRLKQVGQGMGAAGGAVNRCLFAVVVPPHHPPPPSAVFSFFPQRSCYGLPGRLPWVTGPRPPGSLPATQSPRLAAERPGREAAEARVCGKRRRECARAVGAPQPTGSRAGSRGAPPPVGWGGQSYKEGPEVRN